LCVDMERSELLACVVEVERSELLDLRSRGGEIRAA
jgi:hypothetical protein